MESQVGKGQLWTGRAIAALVAFPLIMSAVMKFSGKPEVAAGMSHLGIPLPLLPTLAILEIVSLALYLIPATSVVGAILLTGYLGGAIFAHLRLNESVVIQTVLPILAWASLWLREPRLRALLPIRK